MRDARPAELVLGSVQLGLAYGAANRTGMPSHGAALKLVHRAADAGITKFDTARSYGDSENRLGEALETRSGIRTVTKLSPLSELAPDASRDDVREAVDRSVWASLLALRRARLDCLLLHRASHMFAFNGAVWERLLEHLEDGTVLSLGVSVQTPQEALSALNCLDVTHIQMPFNLLDWRWRESGAIERVRGRSHLTVHARSVFLQGILAADDASVWPRIEGVNSPDLVNFLAELARQFERSSTADLCLAYARGQDWIDGVVVGMETENQLDINLRLSARAPLSRDDCMEIERRVPRVLEQLLNPAEWPK
ncbi:MAG TPA: aldo/keto reductase [Rhizomicrobium sp.]|jgi:aryl-alcohol dehydrogenase-like predicted oxidoreductase